jgi:hypothetical protein
MLKNSKSFGMMKTWRFTNGLKNTKSYGLMTLYY